MNTSNMTKASYYAIGFAILLAVLAPMSANAKSASYYGPKRTKRVVLAACDYYGIDRASSRKWLTAAARDIIYDGAHESGGSTRAGNAGGCYGLMQYAPAWSQNRADRKRAKSHDHANGWRSCGRCSLYRFVRVYKQGGRASVKRHWEATYGH